MENEDANFRKKCLKTHGYKFSSHESDIDKSQSDEDLCAMKPPPIPYEDFKNRIVKIDNVEENSLPKVEKQKISKSNNVSSNMKSNKSKRSISNDIKDEEIVSTKTNCNSKDYTQHKRNDLTSLRENNMFDVESSKPGKELKLTLPSIVDRQSSTSLMKSKKDLIPIMHNVDEGNPHKIQYEEKLFQPYTNSRRQLTCTEKEDTVNKKQLRSGNQKSVEKLVPTRNNHTNSTSITQHPLISATGSVYKENIDIDSKKQSKLKEQTNMCNTEYTTSSKNMPNVDSQIEKSIMQHTSRVFQLNNIGEESISSVQSRQKIASVDNNTNYNPARQHLTRMFQESSVSAENINNERERERIREPYNGDNETNYNPAMQHSTRISQISSVSAGNINNEREREGIREPYHDSDLLLYDENSSSLCKCCIII